MESTLSWNSVVNINERLVEFVACHEFMAWRRHGEGESRGGRFYNLKNAITSPGNGARPLLQSPKGNNNHKHYDHRGPANHVAVWYAGQPWAILMNKQEVTLVPSSQIRAIDGDTRSSAAVRAKFERLFESSPAELRRPLDTHFYKNTIACNG